MKLKKWIILSEKNWRLKKTGKEGERPAFSRIVSSLSFLLLQPSLTRREIIFCSGKGGALPYLRKEAGYFLPGLTRGQKGNPLYANWIDIICRDASQSSAGAQNAWGFGKGFETAIHPTGCCKQFKFGMHLIHYNGILFSSNPPLEDLSSYLSFSLAFQKTRLKMGYFFNAHVNLLISLYCVLSKKYHYI